jgi:hypothetical protein
LVDEALFISKLSVHQDAGKRNKYSQIQLPLSQECRKEYAFVVAAMTRPMLGVPLRSASISFSAEATAKIALLAQVPCRDTQRNKPACGSTSLR